jgi:hypothetical protein
MDQTPMLVVQMVMDRLDRRYAIIGGSVDPEIKAVRRQQIATDVLGEFELACEQTLQLAKQYMTVEEVQNIAGQNAQWQYSASEIRGEQNVTATVDMKMLDLDYAENKLDGLAKLMPFQGNGAIFNIAANILDPDMADDLQESMTSPAAIDKEKSDEYNAIAQIKAGIEARKPVPANPQLRLQVISEIMSDPHTADAFMSDPVAKERLKNRIAYFQNQITQFQQNPQIGRALSTSTFNSKQAPQLSLNTPQANATG